MTRRIQVLHLTVICPFMRNVEGCGDRTAVGVGAALLEQVLVQSLVQVVDGVVEGEQHDLWDLLRGQITCMTPHWPKCEEERGRGRVEMGEIGSNIPSKGWNRVQRKPDKFAKIISVSRFRYGKEARLRLGGRKNRKDNAHMSERQRKRDARPRK